MSLQQREIAVMVNCRAIHLLTYFKTQYGYEPGASVISLPFYPVMPDEHIVSEVNALTNARLVGIQMERRPDMSGLRSLATILRDLPLPIGPQFPDTNSGTIRRRLEAVIQSPEPFGFCVKAIIAGKFILCVGAKLPKS